MTAANEPGQGDARATGHHGGDHSAVISVEEVTRQAKELAVGASEAQVAELARNDP